MLVMNGFIKTKYVVFSFFSQYFNNCVCFFFNVEKEHGMMSAAASLGLVMLWDVDGALSQIDTLLEFSSEKYIQVREEKRQEGETPQD